MDVTFLGTGSAMPTGDRGQTGILVERGERAVLVDCGSGVLHRLAGTDRGYEGVSTLLLTHHHLDHVSDLPALLKARWLAGEPGLTVVGPAGTKALVDGLLEVHAYMRDRMELRVREVGPGEFSLAGFEVRARETRHSMRCHAYRFEHSGGDFVFSGDSEAFDGLAAFAEGAAVLAHDCSFPDGAEAENHPTPSELAGVLAGRQIDRLYLTHFYPEADGLERRMADRVQKAVDGTVAPARDGLRVTV